jgi:integrase/recombinase XerD
MERGYVERSPLAIRVPALRYQDRSSKAFTDAEVELLLNAAAADGLCTYALVTFLSDSGVRANAACTLTLDRLDLAARTAKVLEKYGRLFTATYSFATAEIIRAWLALRPAVAHDYVFLTSRGNRYNSGTLWRLVKRLGVAAGVEGVHPHRFRHTVAVRWLRNGAPITAVADKLGHSSPTVTLEIYGKMASSVVRDYTERLSPTNGRPASPR